MDFFIHIQKTGGTSLREAVKGLKDIKVLKHGYMYEVSSYEKKKNPWHVNSMNIQDYRKDPFTRILTIIRNPFDLLVSYYKHSNFNSPGWGFCNKTHKIESWDDFLEKYMDPNFDWHLKAMQKSLYSFAYDKKWNFIPDEYFKLEEVGKLNDYLELKGGKRLGISNKTEGKEDYKTYYTSETVDKLNSIWEKDLKQFNYKFE